MTHDDSLFRFRLRLLELALAHPGFGPRRISAELAREKWGGLRISEHGIWRVLCRVGLNSRGKSNCTASHTNSPPPAGSCNS